MTRHAEGSSGLTNRQPVHIVFVHGLLHAFAHMQPMLSPEQSLHILDLLGYGRFSNRAAATSAVCQAEHVIRELDRRGLDRVHLVGHSVGGALAIFIASEWPDRVLSIVNVEGNFTLADAFWSAKLARLNAADVGSLIDRFRADVPAWLQSINIMPTPDRLRWAEIALGAQPPEAVHATARWIVQLTGDADWPARIERVFAARTPVALFAGEKSKGAWHVPETFSARARMLVVQPSVGHMMPLESPKEFIALVQRTAEELVAIRPARHEGYP